MRKATDRRFNRQTKTGKGMTKRIQDQRAAEREARLAAKAEPTFVEVLLDRSPEELFQLTAALIFEQNQSLPKTKARLLVLTQALELENDDEAASQVSNERD